jgi:hypothetical protein
MFSQRVRFSRRTVRWLWPLAVLALVPKCLLCLAGYAGLGIALGLGGPEICGVEGALPSAWPLPLLQIGIAGVPVAAGFLAHCRRARTAPVVTPDQRHPLN